MATNQKTPLEKIQGMLKAHTDRFQHNKVPHETGRYIQLVHNPVCRDQFISVQLVVRLKQLFLAGQTSTDIANFVKDATANAANQFKISLGLNVLKIGALASLNLPAKSAITQESQVQQRDGSAGSKVLSDDGKQFYRFKYETYSSKGPALHPDFIDKEKTIGGIGNGLWDEQESEQCCQHQHSPQVCGCQREREYLIVTFWEFNETNGTLEVLHEYSIESPIVQKGNQRPLNISEQASVAYWFERNSNDQLVYCEVPLAYSTGDVSKTTIHVGADTLRSMLSDAQIQCTFSLSRITTGEDERILVYSVANPNSKMVNMSRHRTQINEHASQVSIVHHVNPLSNSQRDQREDGLFELVFFSLDSRVTIHQIRDADSLLEYNAPKNEVWVLRVISNAASTGLLEEVCKVRLTKGKKRPTQEDFKDKFTSVWASDIDQHRFSESHLTKTYFSSVRRKMIFMKGNIATIYFLDDHDHRLKRTTLTGENCTLFIAKTSSDQISDAYLIQMQQKLLTSEELRQLPATDDVFELNFFDVNDMTPKSQLEPKFSEQVVVHKDFDINNVQYEQGLYVNDNFDVMGPLLHGNRYGFGFVRSYVKFESPIKPQQQALATIKYPCLMHCTPYRSASKIFLQNFYYPEDVLILNLGEWKLVSFVDNQLQGDYCDQGQAQTFTAIARAPDGKLCLVGFKTHPFEANLHESARWEVLGEICSFTDEVIETDSIVLAQLIVRNREMSVIVQYDGELVALKVVRDFSNGHHKLKSKMTRVGTQKAAHTSSRFDHIAQTPRERAGVVDFSLADSLVETNKRLHLDYTFGKRLTEPRELQSKRILLSKHGNKVYFVVRDSMRKLDQIKSVKLLPSRKDDTDDQIPLQVETIYEANSRIIYVDFDHQAEQQGNQTEEGGENDVFWVIDSSKKIQRLVERRIVVEAESGGVSFAKKAVYTCTDTIELEKKLSQEAQSKMNFDRIFNDKYPFFNITERALQYQNFTIGFDSSAKMIPTLADERVESVRAIRSTAYVGGFCKQKTGSCIFFMKPNMGQRAIDCFGVQGPKPSQTHIVGNGLILFSWRDCTTRRLTTKLFNNQGRFLGLVEPPKLNGSSDPNERVLDLEPVTKSHTSQFFLMARKEKQYSNSYEGAVCQLMKNSATGRYEFSEIHKLIKLGKMSNNFFQVAKGGDLCSVKFSYKDEIGAASNRTSKQAGPTGGIMGCYVQKTENWCQYKIILPRLCIHEADEEIECTEEEESQIHVDITENFIVLIRRNGVIFKIKRDELCQDDPELLNERVLSSIDLPLADFIEDKFEVDEIGLKWIYTHDLVQFKLKHCLLLFDIRNEKEVSCLNNYEGVFDDPMQFVLTSFYIPARSKGQSTRKYIDMSHDQTFVKGHDHKLLGRLYYLHDELSMHNILSIAERDIKGKKLRKVDLQLAQSSYMDGESAFHLFYKQFNILERLHQQILGTDVPGETNEIDSHSLGHAGGVSNQPWFRRIAQLLIRKNQDGESPLNLAIKHRSFRCFELMLSILLNADDTFVSRNFLKDLGSMMELEAKTVEEFFERKLVDNFASMAIEKVRWTLEQEQKIILSHTQLFNKKLIEQHTAPNNTIEENDDEELKEQHEREAKMKQSIKKRKLGIHSQLVAQQLHVNQDKTDMAMKAVDVKLLDLDWLFEDGNGQRFVWMLSLTSNEALFKTKQVTTVIDLLWERYQEQIFQKVFKPYLIYFVTTLIYFTFFLREVDKGSWFMFILEMSMRLLVLANMFLFEILEVFQLRGAGWRDYLLDFWNTFDQISFVMNALTMFLHAVHAEVRTQKLLAAVAMFMMYIKLFYWLRLFESTAAFIRMLYEIINDIVPFLTFLVCCIAMFANSMLILDQSRRINGEEDSLIGPVFGVNFLDAFVRTYLVALGEFDIEAFNGLDSSLVWCFFLLTTFIAQLLFMNLLIAMMGDTFDRVQEMRVQAATKEKISMMKDFIWVIDMEEEFKNQKHVLVVEQQILSSCANQWEGKIGQLKSYMRVQTHSATSQIKNMISELSQKLATQQSSLKMQNREMNDVRRQIVQIENAAKSNQLEMIDKLTAMTEKLEHIHSAQTQGNMLKSDPMNSVSVQRQPPPSLSASNTASSDLTATAKQKKVSMVAARAELHQQELYAGRRQTRGRFRQFFQAASRPVARLRQVFNDEPRPNN